MEIKNQISKLESSIQNAESIEKESKKDLKKDPELLNKVNTEIISQNINTSSELDDKIEKAEKALEDETDPDKQEKLKKEIEKFF